MTRVMQLDLAKLSVREVNQFLHHALAGSGIDRIEILNPDGNHSIAVGLDADVAVDILGHAGYFIAGMNKRASVTVHGNVGWSVAENIMSGVVRVKGHASESAGASGHGPGRPPAPVRRRSRPPRPRPPTWPRPTPRRGR